MPDVLKVALLGSTGSIGRQAVEVAQRFPDRIRIISLSAHSSARALIDQARALGVRRVAVVDSEAARVVREALPDADVHEGPDSSVWACRDADLVLNALVGAAGLRATLETLEAGSQLALANKESLVVGGDLVMGLAEPGQLIPVDSEHSAIFQCLVGEPETSVSRLWLTASGGPFRGYARSALDDVTVEQALDHPRWDMGPKITIDSATLMNKGLEVIEAHRLFRLDYDRIRVVVHPQSAIHSMVEFTDGAVKAHLGPTDMRGPIQYAFSYPERWDPPLEPLDLTVLEDLTFEAPDLETFRCLALAFEAGRQGGTMPAVLNAANEEAVAAFLADRISLANIDRIVESVLEEHNRQDLASIEQIEAVDEWARARARVLLSSSRDD